MRREIILNISRVVWPRGEAELCKSSYGGSNPSTTSNFFSLPKEVVLEVVDLKAYKVAKEVARNSCGRIELWGFYDFLLKAAENDEIRKKERAERRNKKVLRP